MPLLLALAALLASWTLGGTLGDGSGNGHAATVDPVYSGVVVGPTAATFDGHGRLNVAASPAWNLGTSDWTLSLDVATTDVAANLAQFGTTQQTRPFLKIELASSRGNATGGPLVLGAPRCRVTGTEGSVNLTGKVAVTDGGWHHVECSRHGSRVTLTVDGVVRATRNVDVGALDLSREAFTMGTKAGTPGPSDTLTGSLRSVTLSRQ